ncbi:FND11 protein, partial [Cochlearius cochlearius]|nr:FND11 protein [Cochlearius cochlearius]
FLTQQLSFGIMAVILNEFETSLESAANSEDQQGSATWESYLERRNLVLQFLHCDLSLDHLQHYRNRLELLKKCYFYLEIEPKHMNVRNQNHVVHRTDILQLIDPCRLQRLKKMGKNQTEIQLSLLTELLEQLERGWEELRRYVDTCDVATFLSQWDLMMQKLSKLTEFMGTFLSLQVPGKLYVKQQLVSYEGLRGTRIPNIRLSICMKMPLVFDRKESFAHKDWAKLTWFTENQESRLEKYELCVKLLTNESPTEVGYGRSREVTSNTCVVQDLQPGRSYEFTIRRSETQTVVFKKWRDSLILKTKADATEDAESSACT